MASAGDALIIVVVTGGIAAAIGYGIYRAVTPKGNAQSPAQMGRKWFAWMALVSSVTMLPRFFETFAVDAFLIWMINLVVLGALAFALGWGYGKFKGLKLSNGELPEGASSAPSVTARSELANINQAAPSQMELRLKNLDEIFRNGAITKTEYDYQRNRILNDL